MLIVTGGQDGAIGAGDAEDLLAAATEAGSPATLQVCAAAGHTESPEACPEDYAGWVLGFLQGVIPPG